MMPLLVDSLGLMQHNTYCHFRWFDKSFQLIIEGNGEAAINFEHAWGDGVAVMRFFNEIYEESSKENFEPNLNVSSSAVALHEFELDQAMKDIIHESKTKFESFVSKLSFHAQEIEEFGKNYIKSKKLSPDAVLQLAFQVLCFARCRYLT